MKLIIPNDIITIDFDVEGYQLLSEKNLHAKLV
jgi:hypothetical protein